MAKTSVVPATEELIAKLYGNLREIDQRECEIMTGRTADEALEDAFRKSDRPYVGLIDGEPVLAFGVVRQSILAVTGIPWLVATNRIYEIPLRVVRESIKYVKEFMRDFDRLENYVHSENALSRNWLKWLGFTIEAAEPIGAKKELFNRFWKKGA